MVVDAIDDKPVLLTRENIRAGHVQRMIAAANPGLKLLSEAEIRASLDTLLGAPGAPHEIWVFGYGSLIWNPAFEFVEQRVAQVHGFHRRFCLWTHLGRGTIATPGLMLALVPGGSCRGVAYRIAADAVQTELEILWRREMIGGSYLARWITLRTPDGPVRAIAFTINRANERYAGRLTEETMATAIAAATGQLGPCSEYLFNTVSHLAALGIHDRPLERLRDRVAHHPAATHQDAPRES
jgi:cation transport protein ChaC